MSRHTAQATFRLVSWSALSPSHSSSCDRPDDSLRTAWRNQQGPKQPPNDFGLSDFEGPIHSKLFILLVPGGGSNPHDRKGRRILSLFFGLLQDVAADRKMSHNMFALSLLRQWPALQSVALKCTKVGNEQPSKQPLKVPADFRSDVKPICTRTAATWWPFSGCLQTQPTHFSGDMNCTILSAMRSDGFI
jgi:hypothetical protein